MSQENSASFYQHPNNIHDISKLIGNIDYCIQSESSHEIISKLLVNINFHYCDHFDSSFHEETQKIFGKTPFLTIHISEYQLKNDISHFELNEMSLNKNEHQNKIKIFSICSESHCVICSTFKQSEETENSLIQFLSQYQQERAIPIILCDSHFSEFFHNKIILETSSDIDIEVKTLYEKYQDTFLNHFSLSLYIKSIICFKIRRFYFPSKLFEEDSFFQVFDNYKFNEYQFDPNDILMLHIIGSGSTSTVYLVVHIKTLYVFAIKIFNSHDFPESEILKIIEKEKKFYETYSHPFILRCYGMIKFPDRGYLSFIFEHMSNGSLTNMINRNNYNEKQKFKIFIRITFSINYLHANNYVHRDLHPDNILINHDGDSFLSDLGSANVLPIHSQFTRNIGRDVYRAPELLSEDGYFSTSSDIYTLGMILYFLFEGQIPDNNEEFEQNQNQIFTKYPQLADLFELMTNPNPKKRVNTFYIMLYVFQSKPIITDTNFYLKHFQYRINENYKKRKIKYIISVKNENEIIHQCQYQNQAKKSNLKIIQLLLRNYDKSNFSRSTVTNYLLGKLYFYDIVIPANYAKAFKYFQKVANKNHPGGLYHLGILYLDLYRSTNENDQSYLRKSLYYIQKSSDQSFTPACYVLGRLWIEKNDIPVKIEKIIHYFEIASSVFSESYFYLGYIYQSYLLDLNKAKYYFKIASDHHHSTSMYLLASIILEESSISGNTVQDMNHAIYYLELSAQQNNSEAQFLLGSIYLENETVYNLDKAIHYFQLAASQNHVKSQHILGLIYFKYQFMASDLQKAIYYFKLAASQNYSHAQFYLGLIYTHLVSPPQIQTSLYYYELAAQQNHSNALFCLGLIYYSDGSLHDLKKAAYYFELASKSNSPYANFYLALMYYDGIIFPNDNAKAAYYLELSLQEFFIQKTTDITFMNTLFLAGVIYFENTYLEQSHEKALKYFHIWIKAKEK